MIVLVLGATGFTGKHAVRYFRQYSYKTIGVTRADCDFLDLASTQKFFATFINEDVSIINCAVINKNIANSYTSFIENLAIFKNILESISVLNVKSFIQLSSFDVYGSNFNAILSETVKLKPEDWYGLSKMTAEAMLDIVPSLKEKTIIFRVPGVYSLGSDDITSVIAFFKQKLLLGERIHLSNAGNTLRDYVHISDLLALIKIVIEEEGRHGVFNIGSGTSLTLNEIIQLLSHFYKKIPKISYCDNDEHTFDIVINCNKVKDYFPEIIIHTLEWHLLKEEAAQSIAAKMGVPIELVKHQNGADLVPPKEFPKYATLDASTTEHALGVTFIPSTQVVETWVGEFLKGKDRAY